MVCSHSSIGDGGTSALLQSMAKIRVQIYEPKIGKVCGKIRVQNLRAKLLNQLLAIFWKLYAGKFLETICWEIWVDTSGFLMGVIMAQCYSILRFQGNGTWSSVEHPGSADLSRTKRSEVSHKKGEQGDGDAQPTLVPKRVYGG